MTSIKLTVNGKQVSKEVEPRTLLVELIRDQLHLTGTHVGCDTSQCGACTVHVNGKSVKSCTMLAVEAAGQAVTTIEGLANGSGMHPMQEAFRECHGLQCGFCTPGFLTTVTAGLRRDPRPTHEGARDMIAGNLCRCTGYQNIVRAVERAAELESSR